MTSAQWRIYGEWAFYEVSETVKSVFSTNAPTDEPIDGTSSTQQPDATSGHGQANAVTKAQARRAQVRRAQISHRQRKLGHIKQLELDVSRLRSAISKTQGEVKSLKRENEAMRARLGEGNVKLPRDPHDTTPKLAIDEMSPVWEKQAGHNLGGGPATLNEANTESYQGWQRDQFHTQEGHGLLPALDSALLLSETKVDDVLVTLSVDETLGSPCFRVSPRVDPHHIETVANTAQRPLDAGAALTLEQEHMAINFILSYVTLQAVRWLQL